MFSSLKCCFPRLPLVVAGVFALVALGPVASFAQSGQSNWAEIKLILDISAPASYFSFRCYTKGGKHGVGGWKKNLPVGSYFTCSGSGDRRPAYVRIQPKDLFFDHIGPPLYLHSNCKRLCARIVSGAHRGDRFQFRRKCDAGRC